MVERGTMRDCRTCGEVVVCISHYYELVNCRYHMGGFRESDREPKPTHNQFDDQYFLNGY
jgi:hypothetical protein